MGDEIRIGASGFAECALVYPKISLSKVRPFKFKTKGEGAGRSGYYKKAIDTIRQYHASNNDRGIFKRVRQELGALYSNLSLNPQAHLERIKITKNIEALIGYERIYGDRLFQLHPRHHLAVQIGGITVTAQPDLWVSENGVEVLIKIGAAKKKSQQIDIMLYLLRKAAVASGYRIRARNVAYLDVTNGRELSCQSDLGRFNKMFRNVAESIRTMWPEVTPTSSQTDRSKPHQAISDSHT
jgi:hypothetical protein